MILPSSSSVSAAALVVLAVTNSSAPASNTASPANTTSPANATSANYSATGNFTMVNSNLTLAVEKCSVRMNKQLPSFVPTGFKYTGTSRQHWVKAEEVVWNYVQDGWDDYRGVPINNTKKWDGVDYVTSNTSIGSSYIKALFRGYTDSTFTNYTKQPSYTGFQGPIMRGEVGDMVEVMLYNDLKIASHPISMHSMGLHYSPESEGSDYYRGSDSNGTAIFYPGSAIQPGECFVYKWLITEDSAPDATLPSKLWSYHGDVLLWQDVMTGLFGPVIVYRKNEMVNILATRKEFVMYYSTTAEYRSYYLNANIRKYLPQMANFNETSGAPDILVAVSNANETVWGNIFNDLPPVGGDTALAQAFTTINGFAYGTMPPLQICQDDQVIWHFYSNGAFNDGYHVAHAHGNNFKNSMGSNTAAIPLLPASMSTVTMNAANIGFWQILCHTADHMEQGMEANYNVTIKSQCESMGV